jgi:hypothetical protein
LNCDAKELAKQIVTAQALMVRLLYELLTQGDIDRARDALGRLTGQIRIAEPLGAAYFVATYDLGIPPAH